MHIITLPHFHSSQPISGRHSEKQADRQATRTVANGQLLCLALPATPRPGFSRSRPAKHGQTQTKNINKSTSSQLLNKIKQKKNKTFKLITKTSSNSLSPIPTKVDFLYLLTNLQSLFLSSIYYTYIHTYTYYTCLHFLCLYFNLCILYFFMLYTTISLNIISTLL